ncbi:TetR/AcrR family transcriptional regulator [Umezawaea tangerina]|uniref:TetR family transcriptional regulator n=1 Tax=Umezawaea tangerina TaxID=84725 RepID=A0A2T0SMX6_9PSEU|nr:TetR/AcrR family transcriptional regulator [Umezawaea tangerina]PRY34764.1 TetR family transcriptional regulator [Umezawaea tangerina]
MSPPEPPPSGARTTAAARAPRADAKRNREKLIAAARDAFTATDDTVALESVARDAGVGIGTLYRHFPTREALVEAVYATEIDDVAATAPALLAELPPEAALRAWMKRYAAFVATKRGMITTLRAGWESGSMATPVTRERVNGAIALILAEGARTGTLRADVTAQDVSAMLLGVFLSTTASGEQERTGALLELVVDALRPHPDRPRAGQ